MENEKEIEETVKSFKCYIKKVIEHSAIDYARKLKSKKINEIQYNNTVDTFVSLSCYDEDTFFNFENTNNIFFSNNKYEKVFKSLTKKEQQILLLISNDYTDEEISKKLNISIDNVYSSKYLARKKFKKRLE